MINTKLNKTGFPAVGIITIALAFIIVYLSDIGFNSFRGGQRFQHNFIKKIESTYGYIDNIKNKSFGDAAKLTISAKERGISLLVFEGDELIFWSDNNTPFKNLNIKSVKGDTVLSIANIKYYLLLKKVERKTFIGLIHLESNYQYQNKFLINGIHPGFDVSGGAIVLNDNSSDAYKIYNEKGKHVFSLEFKDKPIKQNNLLNALATAMLFLGLLIILFALKIWLINSERKIPLKILLIVALIIVVRSLMLYTEILKERFFLFDSFIYATRFAPTFGDLMINSILILFFAYLIYRYLNVPGKYLRNSYNRNAWIGILNLIFVFVLWYAQSISKGLILHSSIQILANNISQISHTTLLAYLVFAINYFTVLIIAIWIHKNLVGVKFYLLAINCCVWLLVFYVLSFPLKISVDIFTVIFGFILYSTVRLVKFKFEGNTIFSSLVFFLLIFSVYILTFTSYYNLKKENTYNNTFAVSLSNEHDPVAEYLFEDLYKDIRTDSIVVDILSQKPVEVLKLYTYLSKNYFIGFWKKYDRRITVCRPVDSVLVEVPDFMWYHCYDYFKTYIEEMGVKVQSSPFYYLDNYTGLISYLGWLEFSAEKTDEISLFIELESKLTTAPLGYPELLLDETIQKNNRINGISYAKYYRENLISHTGNYNYSLKSGMFELETNSKFYSLKHSNHKHLVYRPDQDSLIVISRKVLRLIDMVVLFSYIFVFYYLIALLLIFILVSSYRHLSFRGSLRNKIQFSVILILIASMLLISGSTIWFNIRKYNQTQFRVIKEKIQSVYVELEHKLTFEKTLTKYWSSDKYDNLDQLLIKFSDVFYSDINLYDTDGMLLATSRPEIFQLGFQDEKMNPIAYHKMHSEKLAQFVHREKINKLSYLSAYVPFLNSEGKVLAYLNLPYFTKQRELQEDITTLTVAIINIYVLLIVITIIIAVVIANQITKPLEMIQARFRNLAVGEKYETIKYNRQDEIGNLVLEYNNMVNELEKSIEKLAKSERESAWRHMAKQVAHEIKNPLTPMRLSVQQLQRAWNDKTESFDKYLKRVTETLIEQIDNLSTIAGEFSNFAKMPTAKLQNIAVDKVLTRSVKLFADNERIKVSLNIKEQGLFVEADPEQLNRVFINIIKNGIQSIPFNQEGRIKIKLYKKNKLAVVEIQDNGKGIPDNVKPKLFIPNFTTKTSGMGLGLAIVKNVLDQIGGEIELSTIINKGTLFKISLPLVSGNIET